MSWPAFTKLAAAIFPTGSAVKKAEVRQYGLEIETALNALYSMPPLINGYVAASVSANVLTVAVKTAAGADPSAGDPVYVWFRSSSAGNGTFVVERLTAALSFSISATSTLGASDGKPLDLAVVIVDFVGTLDLGIVNLSAGGVLYPLPPSGRLTTVAEGGAGGADSAGVVYSSDVYSSRPYNVLATLHWTKLTTAGVYAAAPDRVEAYRPGRRLAGDLPLGAIFGLTLANNASDANNDIDIATGSCTSDDGMDVIALTSAITKRSDVSWAVGSGTGGFDTGSKTTNQWLYVWLIKRSDTGVVDALFSASASAPTLPSNYDRKRLIGIVLTGSPSNLVAFKQDGDTFTWNVPINDASASNPGTSAVLRTLTAPPLCTAIFTYWLNNVTTAAVQVLLTETAQTDTTPTTVLNDLRATATSQALQAEFRRKVDASSQIRARHQASGASDAIVLTTRGFVFARGRPLV